MGPLGQSRLTGEERAKLVAYLDGELDHAEAQAIATKLAQSAELRREVEAMRATWNLLDLLPRARASDDLGSKTLTAVSRLAFPTPAEADAEDIPQPARRVFQLATCVAAAILSGALGFMLMRWSWPDPNSRLARQLSLAEHLDEYRVVETFDYLQRLDESELFDESE